MSFDSTFSNEKLTLTFKHLSLTLTVEAMQRTIGRNDSMTRHLGRKWITSQGLSYRLCTATTYAPGKLTVGDGLTTWHIEQLKIDATLKFCNLSRGNNAVSDIYITFHDNICDQSYRCMYAE